ncbi:putative nonribosomal peptide synthetase [Leucogyrophana mollusca]|uniref:Nonribosomal peptide synthetase n=1 Tax=Leucogyrophana mollusca TaxID=85980 RepID=A0ACB8BS66_9AGAM|nr:putative nonribosomal peptide synthetase [Leucogyrophana mollusca]
MSNTCCWSERITSCANKEASNSLSEKTGDERFSAIFHVPHLETVSNQQGKPCPQKSQSPLSALVGDGMIEPPPGRWSHAKWYGGKNEPGKYHSTKAGFISDIDQFDHLEFGISAQEAAHFDPAIRLTLEAAHCALQDSGIDYRGSKTGVFLGNLLLTQDELDDDPYEVDNYNGVGRCVSIRANRISFTFDLRGPSLTVDTACSASATAMHLALSSIKHGEIDQALVVGANTIINPEHTVSFSKLGVLSPTGSSKSFDASADGYARGEGIAAVLIKRLDRAVHDGDAVYSVLTGSAINANGKGKSLTMPEGVMQAETIRDAYAAAKRDPAETFFVELHATGTKVGDPIEANAAAAVFSKDRPDGKTLRVGSVKANIGHTEGCSFLASLIKVSLMLHRKEILPNIRFNEPNPKIDFVGLKMRVQTELEKVTPEMAAHDGKWVASVSSYGVGGSNAHVVMETFEAVSDMLHSTVEVISPSTKKPLYLFAVGALTEPGLGRWQESLTKTYDGVVEAIVLRSLARELGRQARAYPTRSFAIAPSLTPRTQFSKPVIAYSNSSPKLCLVFSGQGPQHIYMGRQLAESYPIFLDAIMENDRILVKKYGEESMLERTGLFIPGVECKLASNGVWPVREVVLSIVFVQVAMVDLIRSLGIGYDMVVGHSLGEIAMGYASGHYDREVAIGIAVARAAAMTQAEGNGAMVALGVGVQKAKIMIRTVLSQAKTTSGLWIAGINSPSAVTVAGTHELVDAIVELAASPNAKVFAAKLRVGCAFHTPLMEPQEELFKSSMLQTPLVRGTNKPAVRVMSTTDGKWLDRDFNIDYCWDNVRCPVLFGTAINKIITDYGPGGLLFLEIAPHPVLTAYVEQCGGVSIPLIRRPNPKTPDQNTGEQYQFLEGVGNLLAAGFKAVDFDRLYASPDGKSSFCKLNLPDYPFNKSYCWHESGEGRSRRLHKKPRPLAESHFRINVDSHPDLTGHVVFDAVLFPASGYVDSILENGAMVASDIVIHKPLILSASGALPAHAGCIIEGNKWQFKASTNNRFSNGDIILDSIYASGSFSCVNPAYDENSPRVFDIESALARTRGSVSGEEFYDAIPGAYRYQDHFKNYLKVIHEIDDAHGWGGKAYLTRIEVPEGTPDVLGSGYVIHPGVLDSITQCGLAMFINMDTKFFDFNGVFLPVKIDALRRWDSHSNLDLDSEVKKGLWTYHTPRTWAPTGSFKSDYVVANSEGRVLLTIEGFEITRAPDVEPVPITDDSLAQRLTTIWQSKSFPSSSTHLLVGATLTSVFDGIARNAGAAGRQVIRVVDFAPNTEFTTELDSSLTTLETKCHVMVEYFCAAATPEDADLKVSSLTYTHGRSLVAEWGNLARDPQDTRIASFDIVLHAVDLSAVPVDLQHLADFLVPSGILILIVSDSKAPSDSSQIEHLSLPELCTKLSAITSSDVQVSQGTNGSSIVIVRITESVLSIPACPFKTIVVHPFVHGKEEELVDIAKNLSADTEFWITGNDDAAGIGALGIAACMIAESPEFTVRSILFEDHSLSGAAREKIVYDLRGNSLLLEQHMKISRAGEIFVRRLVHGSAAVKDVMIPAVGFSGPTGLPSSVSAHFPPSLGDSDVEVRVSALGIESTPTAKSAITFVGIVGALGPSVKAIMPSATVVGISCQSPANVIIAGQDDVVPLPPSVSVKDAAALPPAFLAAWIGLVHHARMTSSSVVLIHDALTVAGFSAVQLVQRFGGKLFCTVSNAAEAKTLISTLDVPEGSVAKIGDFSSDVVVWLRANGVVKFDIIFNSAGRPTFTLGANSLSVLGSYLHNQVDDQDVPLLPSGVASTHVLQINELVAASPSHLAPLVASILAAHASQPFILRSRAVSNLAIAQADLTPVDTLVIIPDSNYSVRVDPTGQLFDPRKSYILIGGCSELGVRIAAWMSSHGARHILMTSRRGLKGLTKVDNLYVDYLRSTGVHIDVVAADALSKAHTSSVIESAKKAGPIGGIFLMTVVLRDAKFTNLTQDAFNEVYQSKVAVLDVLLNCVDPASLDFILLFSTIGSVFGNAGQAAYCASQLYLDRIADDIPNAISMSFPPITDSGIFKRLVLSTKGKANTAQLTKTGMTTAQVCNFIGDSLIRRIAHYVPMLSIGDVPDTFPVCEPLLYGHLLPAKFILANNNCDKDGDTTESPATLLASILGMDADQINANALITSFGLDSLGATRYSNQLKARFNIQVSQIELLGSMTIHTLDEMVAKVGMQISGEESAFTVDDGSATYGEPLIPILNDRLAYDEPYTTDASPHQYRIWVAQHESDNARRYASNKIESSKRYSATQWDTHEGYFVTLYSEAPLDIDRMADTFSEVVQRHGALRTAFTWNEELGKLQQTIYPSVNFKTSLVDLSNEENATAKAYDMSLALNMEPNFKLDRLPLLTATMFNLGGGDWAFSVITHHIIIDEASIGVFFYELSRIYSGGPGVLPDVPIHYSDFSDWLKKTSERRSELREEHLKFWAVKLQETQPLHLALATFPEQLAPITQVEATIGVGALEQYTKVILAATVTPFAGFFAAYNILLYKYSDQSSFVVGTAVSQRKNLAMLSNVIGFFANMLPIKTEIDEGETFAEYLLRFKDSLITCLKHDEVTYEDIVAEGKVSAHERGYFKHLFALGGMNMETILHQEATSLRLKSSVLLSNGEEQYEFLLTVYPKTGQVVLRFDNRLYTENAARQFLDAYIYLVGFLGRGSHTKIRDISVVSDEEHERIVKQLSSTGSTPATETCLHRLVEEQTRTTPHLTAVEFENETLTYAQLNAKANRAARSLIERGVRHGDIVALCLERGISQVLGVLAVLKAGGTFVPLDPEDPALRKELVIEECGAQILLANSRHSREIQKSLPSNVLIVYIDDPNYQEDLSHYSEENLVVEGLNPYSLAYIMFTSGSTGKPKGVMIEHRSISNLVQHSAAYGFREGVRVMSSLAYTFDPFVVDVFGVLSHGATLVTGRKEFVLGDIAKAIRALHIGVLHVTPSILAVLPVENYPSLETVVVAGEALSKKLIEDWSGNVTLMNMYGPTEASVDCISYHITSPSLVGVIGRPLPGCHIYILDKQLHPTPVGVEGEIFIGGIQLARGYLNQPDLTSKVFIENPFIAGERIYKSGDLGLYQTDGTIKYCGRADRQVKLRGQRIELEEIENVITRSPGVQRSAVLIRDVQDTPSIVAFVEFKATVQEGDKPEDKEDALKVFISERLPRFMLPSLIIILPVLPTSRTGKIDRKALKEMNLVSFAPDLTSNLVQPQNDVELELMSIFSGVLRVKNESFGVLHDLFTVGLNSLRAVQAAGMISRTFNVHIGLNTVYLRPTVRELGNLVVDVMGRESIAIMEAEDAGNDFLTEFLPIKKGIDPALFFIHDVTGMTSPFLRLGAFLPNAMYAIGDKHFGSSTGFGTVEAMADHYISLMKSVQPEGPYVICGYSFGGSVALCMATKLTKAGEKVSQLVLFDSIYIPASERQRLKSTNWTQRPIDRLTSDYSDIDEKWMVKLRTEIRKNLDTMLDYEPELYGGPTTLVVPRDRSWYHSDLDARADDHNCWDYCISNLDIKVAAGAHNTMFSSSHVQVLAAVMKDIFASLPN